MKMLLKTNLTKFRTKRDELLNEMAEDKKLRVFVREAINTVETRQRNTKLTELFNEFKLRQAIRSMLQEVARTNVSDAVPDDSTGINKLRELLKNIIPTIEENYKSLTSNYQQRKSFRAHIINAILNSLAPDDVFHGGLDGLKEDVDVNIGDKNKPDDPKFIDIDDDGKEAPDPEDEKAKNFEMEGEDETGRNVAYDCWNKVEPQVLNAYDILGDPKDREEFLDYLVTNLKLYFDKFEDELSTNIEEPTTDAYEQEKEKMANFGDMDIEEMPPDEGTLPDEGQEDIESLFNDVPADEEGEALAAEA